ncbi:MAG: ABC transporter ATP-binding protein [Lachnospiraceae bacterium]|nr:ABC transporter ATP-binding protein [Lachnospiraceae bacterium]
MKERQKSRQYNWFGNILFNLRMTRQWDKWLFYFQFLPVLPNVFAGYLAVWIPARLVQGLEEAESIGKLLGVIGGLAVLMWFLQSAADGMNEYTYRNSVMLCRSYEIQCGKKIMQLDYDLLEQPDCAKLIGNVWNFLGTEHRCRALLNMIPVSLGAMIGILWYGTLLVQKNTWILILAVGNTVCSFFLVRFVRRKHLELQKEVGPFSKKAAYINRQAMERKAGKDIRLFRMADWLLEKYDASLAEIDGVYRRIHVWYIRRHLTDALLQFILNGFSYGYLLWLFIRGELPVSAFVLYIGLIGDFTVYVNQLISEFVSMNPSNLQVGYVREFLDLPEKEGWGNKGGITEEKGVEIIFKDVSFAYPGEKVPTLKNLNFRISPGEKLALIGLNGAGKTTFVKLLCGFYKPTSGEILVNGIPQRQYGREAYQQMLAVLFQDSAVLPFTLDENLTAQNAGEIERDRLNRSLELSGFMEKYNSLLHKGETRLVREVYPDALDFSGGERQKLLFARTLYKKAPILILDEPTAALDPIAENELYLKYKEAAGERTCIFISHRLSSTRFCDRILLMEDGCIVEEGTHDSLMKCGDRYAQLFEVQSKYYREKGISNE